VNKLLVLFVALFSLQIAVAQESTESESRAEKKTQRIQQRLDRARDPLAASKATFYSAALPGLGQFYNRRYWKVPLAWAAVGTGVFVYQFNQTQYLRYRDAFKLRNAGFTTDEFYDINGDGIGPDVSNSALEQAQKGSQSQRDSSVLIAVGLYLLNIIDASVDAHLKPFNVNEDLSIKMHPVIQPLSVGPGTETAIKLTIKL
jgi:TM2 domain-containing membrane protein YozV